MLPIFGSDTLLKRTMETKKRNCDLQFLLVLLIRFYCMGKQHIEYQAFRTGIKATAIFLLGEKQTVSNGIKQDGSMAWMQHRPQMRIRPLFADTGHSKYEHKGTEFGEDADFSPYYGPGIIAIDACTAFSGKSNCLVIED
jgi:hypothetical protein